MCTNLSTTAITKVRKAIVLIMDARNVGEVYLKLAKYMFKVKPILQQLKTTHKISRLYIPCDEKIWVLKSKTSLPKKRQNQKFQEKRKFEL